jgi:hypothetical protein
MGRRRQFNTKEEDLLQRLKRENDRLKKSISSLRKQLSRVDLDRYENLKDLLYKQANSDLNERIIEEKKKLKKKWECFVCRIGFMKIHTVSRRDGLRYYRKCTECDNRTKMKLYNDKVKGLKDE